MREVRALSSTSSFLWKDELFRGITINVLSLLLALLLYYNYILFSSYLGVMVYAYLLSEALWDSKCTMVSWIEYVNNGKHYPRQFMKSIYSFFASYWFLTTSMTVSLLAVLLVAFATWPFVVLVSALVLALVLLLVYVLDYRLFYLTRLHRIFIDDHVLVSCFLIVFLVFAGTIVMVSFVTLSIRDSMTAVDTVTTWLEEQGTTHGAFHDTWATANVHGHKVLQNWIGTLESQYNTTAWAPLVNNMVSYFEEMEKSNRTANTVSRLPLKQWVMDAFPDWIQNKTVLEASVEIFSRIDSMRESESDVTEQVTAVVQKTQAWLLKSTQAFLGMFAVLASVIGALFDFGIRLIFFLTFLFFLLSSKENMLHTLLSEASDEDENGSAVSVESKFEMQLRSTLEGVFLLPVKTAMLHVLATLTIYWALDVPYMFFASNLSLTFTLFPVLYPYLICLPWCLALLLNAAYKRSFALIALHYSSFFVIDEWVFRSFERRTNKSHAFSHHSEKRTYLTSLSVFFGVASFGPQGVVLGPLLVCLAIVVLDRIVDHFKHQVGTKEMKGKSGSTPKNKSSDVQTPPHFDKNRRKGWDHDVEDRMFRELEEFKKKVRKREVRSSTMNNLPTNFDAPKVSHHEKTSSCPDLFIPPEESFD